jgi:SAM-dependent methyltransferase
VFSGCERFFRPGYAANLIASWLPALDGVLAKLNAGARVADVGCGHGASTTLMARAFPNSSFTGSDYHEGSITQARKRVADAGLADQVRFDVASAQTFDGGPYDLVTTFDCLHDMGDPVGAARHIREALAPDGTWMVVEPYAGHCVTDNLNPVGLLLVLHVPVRPERAVPGRRLLPRRPGRRGGDTAARRRRRIRPVPPGGRDALQHRLRAAPVAAGQALRHPRPPSGIIFLQTAAAARHARRGLARRMNAGQLSSWAQV